MLLELCLTNDELELELTKRTKNGSLQKRYDHLFNYMGVLGCTASKVTRLEELYGILKESFFNGDWRAISGKYPAETISAQLQQ